LGSENLLEFLISRTEKLNLILNFAEACSMLQKKTHHIRIIVRLSEGVKDRRLAFNVSNIRVRTMLD